MYAGQLQRRAHVPYDNQDRLIEERSERPGLLNNGNAWGAALNYDNTFAYDAADNFTTLRGKAVSYGNPDQLTNDGNGYVYGYDGEGNGGITSAPPFTYPFQPMYDTQNRLSIFGAYRPDGLLAGANYGMDTTHPCYVYRVYDGEHLLFDFAHLPNGTRFQSGAGAWHGGLRQAYGWGAKGVAQVCVVNNLESCLSPDQSIVYLDLVNHSIAITHICDPLGNVVSHVGTSVAPDFCFYEAFGQIKAAVGALPSDYERRSHVTEQQSAGLPNTETLRFCFLLLRAMRGILRNISIYHETENHSHLP